jgi:predicted protein tyrosine phosphatase
MALTAVNIDKEQAERIVTLPDSTAFISIGNEHEPFWSLQVTGDNVLTMVFSDVVVSALNGGKIYNPISSHQAVKMVDFIVKNSSKKFVVNCQAGVSRSAAVCLFIHEALGHDLKPDFWKLSHPNRLVYQMLREAYHSGLPSQ